MEMSDFTGHFHFICKAFWGFHKTVLRNLHSACRTTTVTEKVTIFYDKPIVLVRYADWWWSHLYWYQCVWQGHRSVEKVTKNIKTRFPPNMGARRYWTCLNNHLRGNKPTKDNFRDLMKEVPGSPNVVCMCVECVGPWCVPLKRSCAICNIIQCQWLCWKRNDH